MDWLNQSDKAAYFASSLAKSLARRGLDCPSCGARHGEIVSRKWVVTSLRRCPECSLMYRAPVSSADSLLRYYQERYASGFTTELPDSQTLARYLRDGFAGTPKDFSRYSAILEALGARQGSRVLDLGCSWGYGVWQLRKSGYDAFGLEVSRKRSAFARERLNVPVVSNIDELDGVFDVVFTAHVLEHIPALRSVLDVAWSRLSPKGLLVGITPNGSTAFRARSPAQWDRLWGLKHPLFLDAEFWLKAFEGTPCLVTTALNDLDQMTRWSRSPALFIGPLKGWELLAVFQKQPSGESE